jgi:small subunit ribosomal protein S24e
MNIIQEKNNPLLERKEIKFIIEHNNKPSPSNNEMLKLAAENLKASESLVKIKKIKTFYGENKSEVTAYLYKDEAMLKSIEEIQKKKKDGKKETKEQKTQ